MWLSQGDGVSSWSFLSWSPQLGSACRMLSWNQQGQRSTALFISRPRSFEVHFQSLVHPLESWQLI